MLIPLAYTWITLQEENCHWQLYFPFCSYWQILYILFPLLLEYCKPCNGSSSKSISNVKIHYIYTVNFTILSKTAKASKTETLDLCQLTHPPDEIHKMINLPASVKIFKSKLKKLRNW